MYMHRSTLVYIYIIFFNILIYTYTNKYMYQGSGIPALPRDGMPPMVRCRGAVAAVLVAVAVVLGALWSHPGYL